MAVGGYRNERKIDGGRCCRIVARLLQAALISLGAATAWSASSAGEPDLGVTRDAVVEAALTPGLMNRETLIQRSTGNFFAIGAKGERLLIALKGFGDDERPHTLVVSLGFANLDRDEIKAEVYATLDAVLELALPNLEQPREEAFELIGNAAERQSEYERKGIKEWAKAEIKAGKRWLTAYYVPDAAVVFITARGMPPSRFQRQSADFAVLAEIVSIHHKCRTAPENPCVSAGF